ncbi:MAG: DUF1992 domain-containing protein [Ktedonobacterales bacterium]
MAQEGRDSNPRSADQRGNSANQPVQRRRWESSVEQQIAEARERGEFDNLRGQGQPLRLEGNVFAKEKALAYSLLKNNQMAPPEIERGKEIDEDLKQAEALLARLRFQRDRLRARSAVFASDRRNYNLLLSSTEKRYIESLAAVNSKILSLNITAPPALHRHMIDIEARLQDFHHEFTPLLPGG